MGAPGAAAQLAMHATCRKYPSMHSTPSSWDTRQQAAPAHRDWVQQHASSSRGEAVHQLNRGARTRLRQGAREPGERSTQ